MERNGSDWPNSEVLLYRMERPVLGNSGPSSGRVGLRLLGATQEQDHSLQTGDEVVGFPIALLGESRH
jgi:hypothetical protein